MTTSNHTTSQILEIFKNFRTCGLKSIVQHSDDKVCFHFRGGMQKRISMVTFEIDQGTDTYNVSFGKVWKYSKAQGTLLRRHNKLGSQSPIRMCEGRLGISGSKIRDAQECYDRNTSKN